MTRADLLMGILALLAFYTVFPDILLHYLGVGSWRRQYTPGVAITFDDGPNPDITPQILDILARHQCQATFFIVGRRAAQYPELVQLIKSRGHRIGAHSYQHRYAWFMSPWATWRDWERSVAILEDITGEKVDWIRPPWGTFNLVTWLWLQIRHKRAVLWNVDGHDWSARTNPDMILRRILKKIGPGSIILLHDAGGDAGAPKNTLAGLDGLCRRIVEEKKLALVKLDFPDWPPVRRAVFTLWSKWENIFAQLSNVERISSSNVFRLSRRRYQGAAVYDPDGRLVARPGDMMGELHFDSLRLQVSGKSVTQTAIRVLSLVRNSLPELAKYIHNNPDYKGIELIAGVTLIHQGASRLGFQVQDLPDSWSLRVIGFAQKVIMRVYHSDQPPESHKIGNQKPKLVWMSRQQLLDRYLYS